MFGLGTPEILALLVLGVLLFGRNLPNVGRYLGKSIVEFQKGFRGIEDSIESSVNRTDVNPEPVQPPKRMTTSVPKFEDNGDAKA